MSDLLQRQIIFPHNISKLITYIYVQGFHMTFGEAYRTQEQAQWYAEHGLGIAHSLHCERLALDLNLFDSSGNYLTDGDHYKPFGEYWKTLNPSNRWGGDFTRKDYNHFEMNDK